MNQPETPCPNCRKPIVEPHSQLILLTVTNEITRLRQTKPQQMTFCSSRCGQHFAMLQQV